MKRLLLLALSASLLGGCYTVRFHHGKRVPEAGAPREQWVHTFFGGIWSPNGPVKVDDLCPMGIASIDQEETVANAAVTQLSTVAISSGAIVTSGPVLAGGGYALVGRHLEVWTPWTLRVVCAKGALRSLKVAVVRLNARGGISAETASLMTDALIAELRRQPGTTVLSDTDISAALGLERQKQLLGCTDDSSCLAEMGGALGVDRLIHGSVGRLGESLVVTVTSIDPTQSRAVSSVSERLKGSSDEVFLDALPSIASQLMLEALTPAPAPAPAPTPAPEPKTP